MIHYETESNFVEPFLKLLCVANPAVFVIFEKI